MKILLTNRGPDLAGIFSILFLCFLINTNTVSAQEENLNVFQKWVIWNNPGSLLIHNLIGQSYDYYDIRDSEIAKLRTKSDWQKRQALVKDKLMEIVGPFPEKSPLNPVITGVLQKDGYRVRRLYMNRCQIFMLRVVCLFPTALTGRFPQYLM